MVFELVPVRRSTGRARRRDTVLIGATGALVLIGMGVVSIATTGRLDPSAPHVVRQTAALALGAGIAGALAAVDHRRSALLAPVLYAAALVLLGLVLVVGSPVNGARAWLHLGPVQFQPSELAKVAVLMLLALLTQERREPALTPRGIAAVVAVAAAPMGLILLQPDFGTFLVFGALTVALLLIAGAAVRHLLVLAVIAVVATGLAWQLDLVEDYQVERLAVFLDADAGDPQGTAYNTIQAQIAVGAGGLFGRGLLAGEQTALGYVPEHHTDFIFTVIAEETGFAGAVVLLGLYALVVWRGLRIAAAAPDMLGTLLAAGGVAVIAIQVFVAVGMTVGLVPVIGLPLPLVSYGGTSLVASLAMIGLMLSVHRAAR
ncbi:MAG: rod shape-determining protein RodA [Actinobacteria bacterium]|nr:rod shape-determining protein RodA [Actinomycetota bacterium]